MKLHWVIGAGAELRTLEESDAAEMFRAVDRNRERLAQWLPWVDATVTANDTLTFLRTARETPDALHMGIWVDGTLAGSIGHRSINRQDLSVSIGYWLDGAVEGRGIVTASCRAMLDHLFQTQGLHRVEIRCATENVRSCAIPERLGFTREGVLRGAGRVGSRYLDLVVWSMLEAEWRLRAQIVLVAPPSRSTNAP